MFGIVLVINMAVTPFIVSIVTVQVEDMPVHAPVQPPNWAPELGVAVNVTLWFALKFALHVIGQLIPLGLDDTLPIPLTVTPNVFIW